MPLNDPARAQRRLRGAPLLRCICLLLVVATLAWAAAAPPHVAGPAAAPAAPATPAAAPATPAAAAAAAAAAVPLDARAVARAAHLAFRPDGGAWTGGGDTYRVRAATEAFEVVPIAPTAARAVAPLRVAAARVARGDRALGDPPASARGRVERDGHLVLDRGELAQHLRNRDDGVELSFSFPARPEGTGDLTVHLSTAGHGYAGETAGGHHFADASSGVGIRVGRATWIDARGAAVEIPVQAVPGGLDLRVPEGVLERAAYPAVLDPLLSPELEIDAPVTTAAVNDQHDPALACDSGVCLVAWKDSRSGSVRVRAARVTPDGGVLDVPAMDLGEVSWSDSGGSHALKVAAGGGRFLVAFGIEAGPGKDGYGPPTHLRAARVDLDGTVVDPGGFDLTAPALDRRDGELALTAAPGGFLAFWGRNEGGKLSLHRAHIPLEGPPRDPDGAPLLPGATPMAATSAGTDAFLLWYEYERDRGTLRGSRVSADGVLLDSHLVFASGVDSSSVTAAVAFNGTHYVVVWTTRHDQRALASRVTPGGALVDASPFLVTDTPLDTIQGAAVEGTTTFVLGIQDLTGDDCCWYTVLHLARLSADGAPLDADAPVVGEFVRDGAIASTGAAVLASFRGLTSCDDAYVLAGARLGEAPAPIEGPLFPIALGANAEDEPSVTFDGRNYLVLWRDTRTSASGVRGGIYGARVSPEGAVLDPSAIPVATGDLVHSSAIFDGENTVVFWARACRCSDWPPCGPIEAARISPDGVVLDEVPRVTPLRVIPAIVTRGIGGGTVFVDDDGWSNPQLFHLDPSGTFSGPTPVLGLPPDSHPLAIASDGSGYLLFFQRQDADGIFGVQVSPGGEVLAPGAFPVLPRGSGPLVARYVDPNYVVLGLAVTQTGEPEIHATRITPADEVLDPGGLRVASLSPCPWCSTLPHGARSLGIASTPEGALLAWSLPSSHPATPAIQGAVLDPAGAVSPVRSLAGDPGILGSLALAADAKGTALLAYARFMEEPAYDAPRVRARLVGPCGPLTCPSGHCVDGVCCDTACGGGDPSDCLACSVAAGAPADGTCAAVDGLACDDGDGCTLDEICRAGVCSPSTVAPECSPGPVDPGPVDPCAAPGACPADEPIAFGGCGCRLAPPPTGARILLAAAALLLLGVGRRRRGSLRRTTDLS
ncbi:hypothetical protein WME95_42060 [Sorangium sp. So ce327]|uniref:hypothetical protein n=1 Tax=Sorangium sp. So ce327 TaxID=3133301 RepID=UPI003F629570